MWVVVYRYGPLTETEIESRVGVQAEEVLVALNRLTKDGRVIRTEAEQPLYQAQEVVIPLEQGRGWEGAFLDHYHAVVSTLCTRLQSIHTPSLQSGGSTYTLDVGKGHPFQDEAAGLLAEFRTRTSELRAKIERHNRTHGLDAPEDPVVVYFGQLRHSEVVGVDDDQRFVPRVGS